MTFKRMILLGSKIGRRFLSPRLKAGCDHLDLYIRDHNACYKRHSAVDLVNSNLLEAFADNTN